MGWLILIGIVLFILGSMLEGTSSRQINRNYRATGHQGQRPQQQYVCPHCKGKGTDPLLPGFLEIITGEWATNKCPNCRGTGKVDDTSVVKNNVGWFG